MNEQYLYTVEVYNNKTQTVSVKLGYTDNVERRVKQLERNNPNFEYRRFRIWQHKTKVLNYQNDEKAIHQLFDGANKGSYYSARISADTMPDGHTECYMNHFRTDIELVLISMGYRTIYDYAEEMNIQVQTQSSTEISGRDNSIY